MDWLLQINEKVHAVVWGPVTLLLLLGIGLWLSVKLKFFPILRLPLVLKRTLGKAFGKNEREHVSDGISPFQAVSTALAGTLGTGNIVGVATAIVTGGPGAIVWMWISAFVGMATKYAEVFLAIRYRRKKQNGELVGGPMYYMEHGCHHKKMAVLFAVLCILSSFGIGNMAQANAVSNALQETFQIDPAITGIVLAVLVGFVILGGIKRIGKIAEKLIPLMSLVYIGCALAVIACHYSKIPAAFWTMFQFAFNPHAISGGTLGYLVATAVRYGVSRGIFSNEAGLGSAPIAHAAAQTDSAVEQGMWGIFEVFFDTIVFCTVTALAIFTSVDWRCGLDGAALTLQAFSNTLGGFAPVLLSIALVFFAFASILGWSYYGEKALEYLSTKKVWLILYRIVFLGFILVGTTNPLTFVWALSDTLNGLMAIPNVVALWSLRGEIVDGTREYFANYCKNNGK